MADQTLTKGIKNIGVSSNALKILGAIFMLLDHVGYMLFPNLSYLRVIGRLAFPIFAYMIAEGCRYTKNKLRYFLTIFILGFLCQLVYFLYDGQLYMSILITFSLSILLIYSLQFAKEKLFSKECGFIIKILSIVLFVGLIVLVYFLNQIFKIDYGFWGCIAPLFASLFVKPLKINSLVWQKIDNKFTHLLLFGIALLILAIVIGQNQIYSLFAIPLLALYSGKRGKANLKYFFNIFYPLHLVVIQAISMII